MDAPLLYEERASVAVITLNRPASLNSLNADMHRLLQEALQKIRHNHHLRCCVITGQGRGFCAGADLAGFDLNQPLLANPAPVIDQLFNPTIRSLQALPVPTIAAVNGIAAGAGVSLLMACDIAIAAPSASFIQAFSKIGLVPDAGGSWWLVERLGLARALALAMTGDKLTAEKAQQWGLIWEVAEDCLQTSLTLAEKLSKMPTKALVATRHLLRDASTRSLDQHLEMEKLTQGDLGRGADYFEGVQAFLDKRPAHFTDR
ncbi:MAG: enoyl-CoA hydratase-related protein [Gammaproteobacteria bacterium]|nr:enoyl-CoA hydratase-related protein [Gammaproteobacteria bacterium]